MFLKILDKLGRKKIVLDRGPSHPKYDEAKPWMNRYYLLFRHRPKWFPFNILIHEMLDDDHGDGVHNHLFPFIKVKKVTDRKTGNEVPKLFISNEYKSLDILKRNIIVSMLGDTGRETIQSYSESVTENDFYLLLEDILQIDVRVLRGYDAEINQAIIKNFTKPKNASDSVRQHLEKVLSKGQNSIFNLIKPLLLSEVQFKTNFQNVEGMETTGIRGDSHFNNSIPRILETIDQSLATRREQELFIAFLDYESRQTQVSGQIGNLDNQQQEVFIQSIKFFDSKYY